MFGQVHRECRNADAVLLLHGTDAPGDGSLPPHLGEDHRYQG